MFQAGKNGGKRGAIGEILDVKGKASAKMAE